MRDDDGIRFEPNPDFDRQFHAMSVDAVQKWAEDYRDKPAGVIQRDYTAAFGGQLSDHDAQAVSEGRAVFQ